MKTFLAILLLSSACLFAQDSRVGDYYLNNPEKYPVKFYAHIREVTGEKWPPNCLRHSFGSYHLAMWENAAGTAHQMGNSEAIVRKSYARAVRKKEAEAWWALG